MTCKKNHKAWNTFITVAGGVAVGTVGVAAVVAAPLEIGLTLALLAGTKMALDKNNSCDKVHTKEESKTDDQERTF